MSEGGEQQPRLQFYRPSSVTTPSSSSSITTPPAPYAFLRPSHSPHSPHSPHFLHSLHSPHSPHVPHDTKEATSPPSHATPSRRRSMSVGDAAHGRGAKIYDTPAVSVAVADVRASNTDATWLLFGYAKDKFTIELRATGTGGFEAFQHAFADDEIVFVFWKMEDGPVYILLSWCGDDVPVVRKARIGLHKAALSTLCQPLDATVDISGREEATEEHVMEVLHQPNGLLHLPHSASEPPPHRLRTLSVAPGSMGGRTRVARTLSYAGGEDLRVAPTLPIPDLDAFRSAINWLKSGGSDPAWVLFGYGSDGSIFLRDKMAGIYHHLYSCLPDNEVMYALLRLPTERLGAATTVGTSFVFLTWVGDDVPTMQRARISLHKAGVLQLCQPVHVVLQCNGREEAADDKVFRKVCDGMGGRVAGRLEPRTRRGSLTVIPEGEDEAEEEGSPPPMITLNSTATLVTDDEEEEEGGAGKTASVPHPPSPSLSPPTAMGTEKRDKPESCALLSDEALLSNLQLSPEARQSAMTGGGRVGFRNRSVSVAGPGLYGGARGSPGTSHLASPLGKQSPRRKASIGVGVGKVSSAAKVESLFAVQAAVADVRANNSPCNWALIGYAPDGFTLQLQGTGSGGYEEVASFFKDDGIVFVYLRLIACSGVPKFVFLTWIGDGVTIMRKARVSLHKAAVSQLCEPFHTTHQAVGLDEVSLPILMRKINMGADPEGPRPV